MILKKVEGRRNPRAWHGSRLTVSGLHGHPSTPNPRPKRRVETPGDPWGVPQPPGPSSPAYGTPPTANRWFLPLSSSQWGQTLPTTSVMFPVRIEPRGHSQGGKKIPGVYVCMHMYMYVYVVYMYISQVPGRRTSAEAFLLPTRSMRFQVNHFIICINISFNADFNFPIFKHLK